VPLWMVALLFLVGLAWIATYCVSKLSQALTRSIESLIQSVESLIQPHSKDSLMAAAAVGQELTPTLGNQLAYLSEGIERLELHLEGVESRLLPIVALAAYRFEKIGWDRFSDLCRKMDSAVNESDQQKRHRKLMRDDHGFPTFVYEDEVAKAIQKGWTVE
jgi:hypothetical protein